MKKVEQYIKDYTKTCSNEYLTDSKSDGLGGYISHKKFCPWLTPDHARRVAEIAREETVKEVCEWLKSNWMKYHWYDPYEDNEGYNGDGLIEDLKKNLEDKV